MAAPEGRAIAEAKPASAFDPSTYIHKWLTSNESGKGPPVDIGVTRDSMAQLVLHERVELRECMPGNGRIGVVLGMIGHIPHQIPHESVGVGGSRSIEHASFVRKSAVLCDKERGQDSMAYELRQQDTRESGVPKQPGDEPSRMKEAAEPRLPLSAPNNLRLQVGHMFGNEALGQRERQDAHYGDLEEHQGNAGEKRDVHRQRPRERGRRDAERRNLRVEFGVVRMTMMREMKMPEPLRYIEDNRRRDDGDNVIG